MEEKENSILIVEDDEINISILSEILGGVYEIHVARNGQEGIEKAQSLLPDLILLDIIMPGMNGYEVIKILRSILSTQEIPIMFVTSMDKLDDERKGLMLGATDYIHKPFDWLVVMLRVGIQMRIVNQAKTIKSLTAELESLKTDKQN